MENEMQQPPETILDKIASTVISDTIKISVDIAPKNKLHAWAMEKNILPRKKNFELTPVYMGTLLRISKLLLSIDMNAVKANLGLEEIYKISVADSRTIAECIALALHNKKSKPPERLIGFILDNFTPAELYRVVLLVIKQMQVQNFISSIILIRGANVLQNPSANATTAND